MPVATDPTADTPSYTGLTREQLLAELKQQSQQLAELKETVKTKATVILYPNKPPASVFWKNRFG